jgi:conjugal transfer mating pair stabilization protein TraG
MIEVFTVGGGEYIVNTFNALATWSGSGGYKSLLRVVMVMGFSWSLLVVAWNMDAKSGLKWFMQATLMYMVMMVPTISVKVTDRTNPGLAPATVANVPIGIGLIAGFSSQIGDYLTRSAETVFVMPASLNYSSGGIIYGAKLLDATQGLRINDPIYATNLNEHFKQCVFYDILLGRKTMAQITDSADIIVAMGPGSESLSQQWLEGDGSSAIQSCRASYVSIVAGWNSEWNQALPKIAAQFFPGVGAGSAQAKLQNDLTGVGSSGLGGAGTSSQQLVRQAMFINALMQARDSFGNSGAQGATDAFAQTRADIQTRNTYSTIAAGAMKWVPLLNIVLTVVFYAMFPIIFLLMLMPNSGPGVAKGYFTGFFYLAAWGPLFAVLNMIFMNRWASSMTGWQAGGLTASNFTAVSAINQDAGALAGYMIMSVPFIAAGMAKGAMSIASHSASFLSPSQRAAEDAAQEQTTGNYAYGNVSLASRQMNTLQQDQISAAPNISTGASAFTARQADSGITQSNADGTTTYNTSPGLSSLPTSMTMGQEWQSRLSKTLSEGQGVVEQKREVANEAVTASATQSARLFDTAQRTVSDETSEGRSLQNSIANVSSIQERVSEDLQSKFGVSKSAADELAAQSAQTGTFDNNLALSAAAGPSAGAQGGGSTGLSGKGGVSTTTTARHSRNSSETLSANQNYEQMKGYLESASNSEEARSARESFFRQTSSSTNSEISGLSQETAASIARSRTLTEEASKTEDNYIKLSNDLSNNSSNSLATSRNLSQEFVNWSTSETMKPENAWIQKTGWNPGLISMSENQRGVQAFMEDKFLDQKEQEVLGAFGAIPDSLPQKLGGPSFSASQEVESFGNAGISDVVASAPAISVGGPGRDAKLEAQVGGMISAAETQIDGTRDAMLSANAEAGTEASLMRQAVADRASGSLLDNISLGSNFNTNREEDRITQGGGKYSLAPPFLPKAEYSPGNGSRVARQAGAALKPGVNLTKTTTDMYPVFGAVVNAADRLNLPHATVTSGSDGNHGMLTGSTLHPSGKALDFRANNITPKQGEQLSRLVKAQLGDDFDVVFERPKDGKNNHLHVEYDPKSGGGGPRRARK